MMPRDREQEQLKAIEEQVEGEGADADLRVELCGDAIVVTMPGTKFSVTYEKPTDSPQRLILAPPPFGFR